MNVFSEPLGGLKNFREFEKAVRAKETAEIYGCIDSGKPHLIYETDGGRGCRLIVAPGEKRARELLDAYRFFDPAAVYFPAKDVLFYQSDIRGSALTRERVTAYKAAIEGKAVIVTTFDALMERVVRPEVYCGFTLKVKAGDEIDMIRTRSSLAGMGYEYASQVQEPGQYSARGGILDIFPMTQELPVRIELWGDEIDSIRTFSPESQRSLDEAGEAVIYPASEMVLTRGLLEDGLAAMRSDADELYEEYRLQMKTREAARIRETAEFIAGQIGDMDNVRAAEGCITYFYKDSVNFAEFFLRCAAKSGNRAYIFVDEPQRCMERGRAVWAEFDDSMRRRLDKGQALPGQKDIVFDPEETADFLMKNGCAMLSAMQHAGSDMKPEKSFYVNARSAASCSGSFEVLTSELWKYKKNDYKTVLLCASKTRAKRLAADLTDEGLSAFFLEDRNRILIGREIALVCGNLERGFEYPDIKFAVLTESEIFGSRMGKKKRSKRKAEGERITSFEDLNAGDYVIHENHGLGIYRGIEKIEVNRITKDFMKIEYDKGANLYVPVTQLDLIVKYSGADDKKPKINSLGGKDWQKTRSKAEAAVQDIAKDLVELYAARQSRSGYQYEPDTVWQREFEELFPYEETQDQKDAIEAVKADMESKKIMDRLICGDVGFGKTEVAIRAAFKAVQEGKQVVYLVPTTILAQQHYDTFARRMKDFPVNVELLCRFRTQKEQKKTVEGLKSGRVDIVVGTHRVLSKDVDFKDLGLLIIDEEQRFGVTHKEKIKQLKKNVDVLSLTATPIPRTLHMSLAGIRDMSVLKEPPLDRMPIQTYVMEYDEEIVREAVQRELTRSGQVYYVFNRVDHISEMADRIAALIPDARVGYAHGQMNERELENVMYSFINGELDVLVATTIIETGLDISNVNTMIIHDADKMGLSQLYQLRGRIGRSNRTAYAFLMYRKDVLLREVAEKRLSAIREFSELGSGFKIAMKDLEIRGAGNLLGAQQHGHMEAVGYDLYCKMLSAAVRAQSGDEAQEDFETSIDINIDAYIPDSYISDENQKLDVYRRISFICGEKDRDEMLDELIDRFGDPPSPVNSLLTAALLKAQAHEVYFVEIKERPHDIIFRLYERAQINVAGIPDILDRYKTELTFVPDKREPYFVYKKGKKSPQTTDIINDIIKSCRELLI